LPEQLTDPDGPPLIDGFLMQLHACAANRR
jgi:hypothetical protein